MRKILILAESGHQIELDDIANTSFLPQQSLDTKDNESFFASLKEYEGDFQKCIKTPTRIVN